MGTVSPSADVATEDSHLEPGAVCFQVSVCACVLGVGGGGGGGGGGGAHPADVAGPVAPNSVGTTHTHASHIIP